MKKFRNILFSVVLLSLFGIIVLFCGCNTKKEVFYNITYTASAGGYIDGQTEQIITSGDNAEPVTAVPNEGYEFVKWSDGLTTPERQDRNVTEDKTVTAQFKTKTSVEPEPVNEYTITYTADVGGYIDGVAVQIVKENESAETVIAVPETGYRFVKWSDGLTTPERKDKNIIADKTVTAEFEKIKLAVTYSVGEGGTIDGVSEQEIEYGNDAEFVVAVPETGYRFVKWSDGQITPEHQEKNVTADITIEAIFEKLTYFLIYETDGNGTIEGRIEQRIAFGENSEEVTAVANEGYVFVNWSDGLTDIRRKEIEVMSDIRIKAIFEKITYSLNYITEIGGHFIGNTNQIVGFGENGTDVKAVPDEGYVFVKWSDGVTDDTRSDIDIKSDLSVVAEFKFLFAGVGLGNWFLIETYQQLLNMYYYPSSKYQLNNDLDLEGINHEPIFDANNWFNGHFYGAGHTIKNLTINTENNFPSLFGVVMNGIIGDLNLTNVEMTTFNFNTVNEGVNYYVGAIAGIFNGFLDSTNVNGKIISNGFDYDCVAIGGLVGMCYGTIANCNSDIQIEVANAHSDNSTGEPFVFGGLVGIGNSAVVRDCMAKGKITVTNSCNYILIGGLIGYYFVSRDNSTYIRNSETDIEITGDSYYTAGGFVGLLECYQNCLLQVLNNAVHGEMKIGIAAGFIDKVTSMGEELIIENCYTDNNIAGYEKAIGFITYFYGEQNSNSLINNCSVKGNISAHSYNNEEQFIGATYGFGDHLIDVSINNCYVTGTLLGRNTVGFVRTLARSQINSCFTVSSIFATSSGSAFIYSITDSFVENCYSNCNEISFNGIRSISVYCFAHFLRSTKISNYYYAGNSVNYFINIVSRDFEILNCYVLGARELIKENRSTSESQIDITICENIEDMYLLADKLNEVLDEELWVNTENDLPKLKFYS